MSYRSKVWFRILEGVFGREDETLRSHGEGIQAASSFDKSYRVTESILLSQDCIFGRSLGINQWKYHLSIHYMNRLQLGIASSKLSFNIWP